ncbi:NAD-binding protein [Klebsiella aerogenes]|uniref:NAD-binding protein n=1 Tax=Klebsiella aerogenes TaxID=548 RepID=UPI001F465A84|nr:NAD-binding protein [Klebsiella aerogenes]
MLIEDASSDQALHEAGADKCRFVLVLRNDDSDNAFIVLAAKEVVSAETRILALVNADQNLSKIKRVQPDIIFSLHTLTSEMLLQKLSGEKIETDNLMELLFQSGR